MLLIVHQLLHLRSEVADVSLDVHLGGHGDVWSSAGAERRRTSARSKRARSFVYLSSGEAPEANTRTRAVLTSPERK